MHSEWPGYCFVRKKSNCGASIPPISLDCCFGQEGERERKRSPILIWEFFLKGFDVPLEGAFIHVITLGLMFDSHFTFLGGELEGKSIKTLDTNFVVFMSRGFILRLDNKKLLRI